MSRNTTPFDPCSTPFVRFAARPVRWGRKNVLRIDQGGEVWAVEKLGAVWRADEFVPQNGRATLVDVLSCPKE
jgi:hypothetical protein